MAAPREVRLPRAMAKQEKSRKDADVNTLASPRDLPSLGVTTIASTSMNISIRYENVLSRLGSVLSLFLRRGRADVSGWKCSTNNGSVAWEILPHLFLKISRDETGYFTSRAHMNTT